LLSSGIATAAPKKDADALFAEGQALIAAQRIDEACDRFAQSLALDPALGTRLNLADCRERQSRFAAAYELYVEVIEEATRTAKQSQLLHAKERLDEMTPKVVRITLDIAEPSLAGLAIKLGDHQLSSSKWMRAIAHDPGSVALTASAPGRKPFEVSREAKAGDQITLVVPALVNADVATPEVTAVRAASKPTVPAVWVIAGSGAVVVSSMLLGLHAKSVYNEGNAIPGAEGDEKIHSAVFRANIATVLFIAGGIGVGVGTYLYLRERRTRVVPFTDGRGAGLALSGNW